MQTRKRAFTVCEQERAKLASHQPSTATQAPFLAIEKNIAQVILANISQSTKIKVRKDHFNISSRLINFLTDIRSVCQLTLELVENSLTFV
jgi:hypothetical protein